MFGKWIIRNHLDQGFSPSASRLDFRKVVTPKLSVNLLGIGQVCAFLWKESEWLLSDSHSFCDLRKLRTTDLHCYSMLALKVSLEWSNSISFEIKSQRDTVASPRSHGWAVAKPYCTPGLFPLRHALPESTSQGYKEIVPTLKLLRMPISTILTEIWFLFTKQPYVSVLCWLIWSLKIARN